MMMLMMMIMKMTLTSDNDHGKCVLVISGQRGTNNTNNKNDNGGNNCTGDDGGACGDGGNDHASKQAGAGINDASCECAYNHDRGNKHDDVMMTVVIVVM